MPTMASITVKKADGTTNIVYDAITASAGDGAAAVWRQDTGAPAGLPVGLRPVFRMQTKWNGPKTARQVLYSYEYPYAVQDTTTTLYTAKDKVVVSSNGPQSLPQGIPPAVLNEAVAQYANLVASALIVQAAQAGYSPV